MRTGIELESVGQEGERITIGVRHLRRRKLRFEHLPPHAQQIQLRLAVAQAVWLDRASAHPTIAAHRLHDLFGGQRRQRVPVHPGDKRHVVAHHHARQNCVVAFHALRRFHFVHELRLARQQVGEFDPHARRNTSNAPDGQVRVELRIEQPHHRRRQAVSAFECHDFGHRFAGIDTRKVVEHPWQGELHFGVSELPREFAEDDTGGSVKPVSAATLAGKAHQQVVQVHVGALDRVRVGHERIDDATRA